MAGGRRGRLGNSVHWPVVVEYKSHIARVPILGPRSEELTARETTRGLELATKILVPVIDSNIAVDFKMKDAGGKRLLTGIERCKNNTWHHEWWITFRFSFVTPMLSLLLRGIRAKHNCYITPCFKSNCSQHGIIPLTSTSLFFTVDGRWTDWKPWSQCSVTCGGGTRNRFRSCTNPPPQHGGKECSGSEGEMQSCNEFPCPSKVTSIFSSVFCNSFFFFWQFSIILRRKLPFLSSSFFAAFSSNRYSTNSLIGSWWQIHRVETLATLFCDVWWWYAKVVSYMYKSCPRVRRSWLRRDQRAVSKMQRKWMPR